jgi:hypothetical protein
MDGTQPIKLKRKYTCPKTRGKHKGGERPDVHGRRKRGKKGPKTYVYGSRVMYMGPTGKTVMGGPLAPVE